MIVVINPSTRGFAMSAGEREPCDHAVISSLPLRDENGSVITDEGLFAVCRERKVMAMGHDLVSLLSVII
ncbi:hypothetical protein [Nonomuraea monospora]|uniref:hypothetical protein n=1 Tax=Nonomuraea monospora TaxID=568818 RepID=UPI0031DCCEBB